jgi:hypothetical protein
MKQHMEALATADAIRSRRSVLKHELKEGRANLSEILRDELPDWLGSMTAERLLFMAPRVGAHAAVSLLQQAQLGPQQRASQITPRQRLLLADEMEKIEALKPMGRYRVRNAEAV